MNAASPTAEAIAALIDEAYDRIKDGIYRTPLLRSGYFSERTHANVFFKYESFQVSGSFKARGVLNKLRTMSRAQLDEGVVAASTGNHGVAVALGVQSCGAKAIVFMPENASSIKVDAVRRHGAEVRFHSNDSGRTEAHARRFAVAEGKTFISPYNDAAIVAGQGTIGIEIKQQLPLVEEIVLSVGGGGLLSGVAGYFKGNGVAVNIIASSPLVDHALYSSIQKGQVVEFQGSATLADGCSGGIEENSITLPLVRDLTDQWALIPETEIRDAMRLFVEQENQLLEGSAALAIAALLRSAQQDPLGYRDRNVVIIICGSRIGIKTLRSLLNED